MITIENVIQILKNDHNFREIIDNNTYLFSATGKNFKKLSYDSRTVDSDTLFFVKGRQFKPEFLKNAVASGLTYYIAEKDYEVGIPAIVVNHVKQAMSLIAMHFYDNPQDKLKILAFTGTKGKTTAAYFAYQMLSEEYKPAMLSTMQTTLDGKHFFKSSLSTPESLDLFSMMATAVKNNRTHLIMEVSSQAYLVQRVYGLTFDVGVFLNISPDHIGPVEHPTFEDYFYHKRLLLDNSKAVVINSNMESFSFLKAQINDKAADYYGDYSDNQIKTSTSTSFEVTGKLEGHYDIALIGKFNQENALAAGLACLRLGASKKAIHTAIAKTTVPGRMEILTQTNGAKVFVDYAHNGISLNKLIEVVTSYQKGKVYLIIGATGNKGESRRKDFGEVINHYPSLDVILTADDPNFENPLTISQEIQQHINRPVNIIVDREIAIKTALRATKNVDDAVIIAGKGADAYQIVNGKKESYDGDLTVAKRYL